jgi:hypothetical protein
MPLVTRIPLNRAEKSAPAARNNATGGLDLSLDDETQLLSN